MIDWLGLLGQYWWFIGLVLVLIIGLLSKLSRNFGGNVPEINLEQLESLLREKSITMIDLAESQTYVKGHIPGAINKPGISFVDGSVELNSDLSAVVLIPMKGLIPMPVLQYLDSLKIEEVYIFKGGLDAWREAGKPVEKGVNGD